MKSISRKKSFYIVTIFMFFFLSCNSVNAARFAIRKYDRTGIGYGIANNSTWRKYQVNSSGTKLANAYCANHDYEFYGNKFTKKNGIENFEDSIYTYTIDESYSTSKQCEYKKENGEMDKGDCSRIIAYIINASNTYYENVKGYKGDKKYYWTQVTVWSYLNEFTPNSIGGGNTKAKNFYVTRKMIRTAIAKGWKLYRTKGTGESKSIDGTNIQVSDADSSNTSTKFYYVSTGTTCGEANNGSYRTKTIKIKNTQVGKLKVELTTDKTDVEICKTVSGTTTCQKSWEYNLGKGYNSSIYLKSIKDFNGKVTLTIKTTYEGSTASIYDSALYKLKQSVSPKPQGMIILKQKSSTSEIRQTKNIEFTREPLKRNSCKDDDKQAATKYSKDNPQSKVCANNATGGNEDEYTAKFSGCNCITLTDVEGLPAGTSVNVLLYQNTNFRYGNLVPGTLYAGGGFSFANVDNDNFQNGITTEYNSKVSWKFADYMGSTPYYYNSNDVHNNNANNIKSDIETAIANKISGEPLTIEFTTKDSNDVTNNSDVTYKIVMDKEVTSATTDANGNKIYDIRLKNNETASTILQMENAYFSTDAKVVYESSTEYNTTDYPIDGGKKYYVPMGYDGKFPFNIDKINLSSVTDGFNFYLEAECDIDVKDNYTEGEDGLRYRTISVENPFPKAGTKTDIPNNWAEWYCGTNNSCGGGPNTGQDSANSRLNSTFNGYPSNYDYKITLNHSKISSIKSINRSSIYTSWQGINKNGSSDFVTSNFETKANCGNGGSCCEIGKFNADCDK